MVQIKNFQDLKDFARKAVQAGNQNPLEETGIQQIEKLFDVVDNAKSIYDQANQDGKIDGKDLGLILQVPQLVQLVQDVDYSELDDEVLDVDENEEKILEGRLSKYVNNQGYLIVFGGILQVIRGIAIITEKEDEEAQ